jgi:hypothetical protein
MFQIFTRTNNEAEWNLYGTFANEAEFKAELPNIRALGLYMKRTRVR